MRDFISIMKDRNYWDDNAWHDTKHTYTFGTGSIIEFKSIDTYGKAHGPRRDVLFINECNNITYKIADQLITRTREIVWMDWNPTNEFWFYTEMQPNRNDIDFITLTYLDNEALLYEEGQVQIKEIESHRHNKQWWQVYALGQLGDLEDKVFSNWALIDEIPHEARLERRGLDFGFSRHPTALIDVYYYNGGFILDERLYRTGLHNKPLADYINNMDKPETTVYADSADPQAIDELKLYGVNVYPAQKGKGSIRQGIDYIQDQQISVTKRSINLIHEYRNYMWARDKDGELIKPNVPEDEFNHAMDAIRYAMETYMRAASTKVGVVTSSPDQERHKSFAVNEKGEAEAFHIDVAGAIKRNDTEWL